jgi:hypothetical protein
VGVDRRRDRGGARGLSDGECGPDHDGLGGVLRPRRDSGIRPLGRLRVRRAALQRRIRERRDELEPERRCEGRRRQRAILHQRQPTRQPLVAPAGRKLRIQRHRLLRARRLAPAAPRLGDRRLARKGDRPEPPGRPATILDGGTVKGPARGHRRRGSGSRCRTSRASSARAPWPSASPRSAPAPPTRSTTCTSTPGRGPNPAEGVGRRGLPRRSAARAPGPASRPRRGSPSRRAWRHRRPRCRAGAHRPLGRA